jgi:uncharacterized protein (DUF849 family)
MKSIIQNNTFILNLAPTGVIPTKQMNQYVPITPEDVADDVRKCLKYGISSVHIHARDSKGLNTNDTNTYTKFIEAIKNVDETLPICVSCTGRLDPRFENRSAVLDITGALKPDMASLTLSSLNFPMRASINEPDIVVRLAEKMQNKGIKPELEVFDLGMMNFAHYLIKKGYLEPPFVFNFILGNIASAQAQLLHLGTLLSELPDNSVWLTGGIGMAQLPSAFLSLSQGGGIRTGLEDNIWFNQKRTIPASNETMVERIHHLAGMLDLTCMSGATLRQKLKLS